MTLLERLALYGIGVHVAGRNSVKLTGLDKVPAEYGQTVKVLLEEAKAHKAEIIQGLLYDGFTELKAADGDEYKCTFSVHDEKDIRRWA
ncbi:hypothetical protein LJC74_05360 [Eubacteriales bacterium OttesenSCG-928-A19]|nr:hypothetical protein [Eubacteriales bacterium OttesenSCG-928-A19]